MSQRPLGERIALAIGSGYGALLVNALTYAVSVPLLLQGLGRARFGLWLTLLQALTLVGTGTGWLATPLVREVAGTRQLQVDGRERLRVIVATASVTYAAAAASVFAVALLGAGLTAVSGREMALELAAAIVVVAATAGVSLQVGLLGCVLSGHDRLHLTYALTALQTVLSTAGALVAAFAMPNLGALALGHFAGVMAAALTGAFVTRHGVPGFLQPRHFDREMLRKLVTVGGSYLGYTSGFIAAQSELFMITAVLGPQATALYGIAARLFEFLLNLMRRVPDALVPTLAGLDARDARDDIWRLHLWGVRVATSLAAVLSTVLFMTAPSLIRAWLHVNDVVPASVLAGLAVLTVAATWTHANVVVPFATNRMGRIAAALWGEAGLKLLLLWLGLRAGGLWTAPLAGLLALVAFTGWIAPREAARSSSHTLGEIVAAVGRVSYPVATVGIGWIAALFAGESTPPWWAVLLTTLTCATAMLLAVFTSHERGQVLALARRLLPHIHRA